MSLEITEEDRKSPFFALGRIQAICEAYESDESKVKRIREAVQEWEERNPHNLRVCDKQ